MSEITDQDAICIVNLHRRMEHGWTELHAFLGTLTDEQCTQPTDAAGWTVKDHVVHLAIWEDGICGVLNGKSFPDAMGVDVTTWERGGDDPNAVIQKRYQGVSLDEAREILQQRHEQLLGKVNVLTDDDLIRPVRHFCPESNDETWIIALLVGNTFGHYAEHLPWMAAIVGRNWTP